MLVAGFLLQCELLCISRLQTLSITSALMFLIFSIQKALQKKKKKKHFVQIKQNQTIQRIVVNSRMQESSAHDSERLASNDNNKPVITCIPVGPLQCNCIIFGDPKTKGIF